MNIKIALIEPEIPQNTGTIGRLCVGTGSRLILVGKLGFSLDDKYMKRAGLDYWKHVDIEVIDTFDEFMEKYPSGEYRHALLTKFSDKPYTEIDHENPDNLVLMFGKETAGFSDEVKDMFPDNLYKIPQTDLIRSQNIANAVSIVLYDVLRRHNFEGLR